MLTSSYKIIIKFLIVGGICTILDLFIYMLLFEPIGILCSKAFSMTISTIVNYFLNKLWSFSRRNSYLKTEITKYMISQFLNILINTGINSITFNIINDKMLSFLMATGIATIFNYTLQRYWVFKYD
ncbi:GtrA family protein [Gallibacterium salpingitidis]